MNIFLFITALQNGGTGRATDRIVIDQITATIVQRVERHEVQRRVRHDNNLFGFHSPSNGFKQAIVKIAQVMLRGFENLAGMFVDQWPAKQEFIELKAEPLLQIVYLG